MLENERAQQRFIFYKPFLIKNGKNHAQNVLKNHGGLRNASKPLRRQENNQMPALKKCPKISKCTNVSFSKNLGGLRNASKLLHVE